jgi:hypothetical protein
MSALKKVLNPFGITITSAGKPFIYLGMLTSAVAHVAFYGAIVHFVMKVW